MPADAPAPRRPPKRPPGSPYGGPPLDAGRLWGLVAELETGNAPRTAAVARAIAGEIDRWGLRPSRVGAATGDRA